MRGIEAGISKFRVWCWCTFPKWRPALKQAGSGGATRQTRLHC